MQRIIGYFCYRQVPNKNQENSKTNEENNMNLQKIKEIKEELEIRREKKKTLIEN